MMKDDKKYVIWAFSIGIIPVIWLALLIAPSLQGGIVAIIQSLSISMNNPFKIELCEDSLKTVLILLIAYGITAGVVISSMRNYRKGEEHGSAKWGKIREIAKRYAQKPYSQNKILTQRGTDDIAA